MTVCNFRVLWRQTSCGKSGQRIMYQLALMCVFFSMSDYYPLSACLILFSNLLQHPLDSQAQSDLRLMNNVTSFLSSFSDSQDSEDLNPIIPMFLEISRVAADYVDKASKEPSKNSKRSRGQSFNTAESPSGSDESSDELYETIEPRSRAASAVCSSIFCTNCHS
jgi:hypothetical protein